MVENDEAGTAGPKASGTGGTRERMLSAKPMEPLSLLPTSASARWWAMALIFEWYGDHRDLHRGERRQRQMCIRDRVGC